MQQSEEIEKEARLVGYLQLLLLTAYDQGFRAGTLLLSPHLKRGFGRLFTYLLALSLATSLAGCEPLVQPVTPSQILLSHLPDLEAGIKTREEQYQQRYTAFVQGLNLRQLDLARRALVLKNDQAQIDFVNSLSPDQEDEYLSLVQEEQDVVDLKKEVAALRGTALDAAIQEAQQDSENQFQEQSLWNQEQQVGELQRLNSQLQQMQLNQQLEQQREHMRQLLPPLR